MIKLEQRGFTLVEMLISIGILGIVAPLLTLALFQILTFTERSRAGFEAQADTRNASAWISQDIVMAQDTNLFEMVPVDLPPDPPTFTFVKNDIENSDCLTDAEADWATFTWMDYFDDRDAFHTVSYCLRTDPPADPAPQCPAASPCLVRNFSVTDSADDTTSASNVIAKNIASVTFEATAEREINITIESAPENRFGVGDLKTFKVVMRSNI